MLSENYSAINSWFGYIYQGKIAIFVMLEKIYEIIISTSEHDLLSEIDQYELEIEFKEDFSIINSKEYESIHQVKSGDGKESIGERDIFDFAAKLFEINTKGVLHTKDSALTLDFFGTAKSEAEKHIYSLENGVLDKDGNLSCPMANGNAKKATIQKLLYLNKDKHNNDEMRKIVKKELEEFISFLDSTNATDYFEICNKFFINKKAIDEVSIELIGKIIKELNSTPKDKDFYSDKEFQIIYALITKHFDNYISNERENRDSAAKLDSVETIKFRDILSVLQTDVLKGSFNADYIVYLFKNDLSDVFENFIQELKEEYPDCDSDSCIICTDTSCNLKNQFNTIKKEQFEKFKLLFNNLVLMSIDTFKDSNYRPRKDEIRDILYKTLKEVPLLQHDNNAIYAFKDNTAYSLTLNTSRRKNDLQEKLNTNKNIYELIYEIDVLITERLVCEMEYAGNASSELGTDELTELEVNKIKHNSVHEKKANHYKPKTFKVIDLETARRKLN